MAGQFGPGQEFVVRSLAKRLGVSPMPVREALRRLVTEQALEVSANGIARVPFPSAETLRDLSHCRILIEGDAAAQAAEAGGPALAERIQVVNQQMLRAAAMHDIDGVLAFNQRFHFTLYAAAGSKVVMPLIESLWLQAGPFLNSMRGALLQGTILDHHRSIIAAVAARDGRQAAKGIAADLEDAATVMRAVLEKDA